MELGRSVLVEEGPPLSIPLQRDKALYGVQGGDDILLPWRDHSTDRPQQGDLRGKELRFAHLSHVYNDGASIYITFLFRRAEDPAETLRRRQLLKSAASRVIVAHGGTISHQHGVGLDHASYLSTEKGPAGMKALETLCRTFDPDGMMNPGKLLEK